MLKSERLKKHLAFVVSVFMLSSTFFNGITSTVHAAAGDKTFDLVEITDFHGALQDTSNPPLPIGAVLANRVKTVKANNSDTIIFGGGDLYQGTPISNLSKGVPVQQAMSNMGMEFTALGNHEFDWCLDTVQNTTMQGASYNIICANLYNKNADGSNGARVFDPYKIITKDGVRIAFIGAITNETPNIVMPAYVADKNFTDAANEINSVASDIKNNNKADVIIAVIHEGGSTLDTIAGKLKNVNAIFGGHSHTIEQTVVNGIPVLNANSSGKGYIDLKMTVAADKTVSFTNTTNAYVALDNTNGYKAANPVVDPQVKAIVDKANSDLGPTFNAVIGNISTDLTRTQDAQPYGESQLGNWASDVVRNFAKADMGIANNGGLRCDLTKGDINVGAIFTLMPFDNEINTVTVNKAQLKAILEQAVGTYADPSNASNTLGGKGIQISGIKFTYDASKPYGSKVQSIVRENGNAISDTEALKLAGPDFVLTGGDGFLGFKDSAVSSTLLNTHKLVRDALMDDIKANKTIKYVMNNRITPASQSGAATSVSIADARKLSSGSNATVKGTVTVVSGSNAFIQDSTGGIYVYNSKNTLKRGDLVQVTGSISSYSNLIEITPKAATDVVISSSGNYIAPKIVNISDITTAIQGQFIQLNNVILKSYDPTGDSMVQDSTGSISLYKVPALSNVAVGDKINVIAAVSQYGNTMELTVAQAADVFRSISVVATSDVHGNALNYDYAAGAAPSKGQGLAKVSTYVNSVRANNSNVMLIDDGDTIQGTPLSYYYDMIDTTSEYPMMKAMGAMGYDTWTLGNHEYNYGLTTLNRIIADAKKEKIHVLSANTYNTDNTNFVEPYYIKSFTINGKTVKVGILGLTTKCIPNWEDKAHYAGLHFNDLVDEAKLWVPKVRQAGADVVIVAAHSGEESASDVIPENEIKAMATQVSGIDAIVAGHVHNVVNDLSLKNPNGKIVPVVEPGKWAQYISQIDLNYDLNGNFLGVATKDVAMDNTIAEDPAIVNLIQPYQAPTLKYIQTVLGTSTGEFKGDGQLTQPTAIMDLINKVQNEAAGTQLSIAAPLSASAYIPSGNVTIKDVMSVYVYENFLYGVKMTGKQLKDWMEYSVRYYKQVSNASDSITKDPVLNIADYNLDQLYGATYDIDLTQPACTVDANTGRVNSGNRIKNLKINGILVKDTDVFNVAINNYRYNGGGGFMKAAGLSNTDPSIVTYDSAKALGDDGQVRSLMQSYIQKHKTISPDCSNSWKVYTTAVTQTTDAPTPVTPNPGVPTPVVTPTVSVPSSVSNIATSDVVTAIVNAINNNVALPVVDVTGNSVVSKDIFNAIKGLDKTITFSGNNVTWTFNGKDITSNVGGDIDLSLKTVSSDLQAKEAAKMKVVLGKTVDIAPFSFTYEGALPGNATVKVFIGKAWANKTINVCRYYADKNIYEVIQSNVKVDADGYLTYITNHCSDYFAVESSSAANLPKTGSSVDMNVLVDMGAIITMLGIVMFIAGKRRKSEAA